MTNEEMERAIEFLLTHHAQLSADIGGLKDAVGGLTQVVGGVTQVVGGLADVQRRQAENIDKLAATVEAMREEMEAMREEMREGFNKLILANEVTRQLIEGVARLEVQTSQRVTGLEHRVSDLEANQ